MNSSAIEGHTHADLPWHHLDVRPVEQALRTDAARGLSSDEVLSRQSQYGTTRLSPGSRKSDVVRFLEQFRDPLLYVLLASSLITALVKDPIDAGVILAVVLANALIGFL